MPIVMIATGFFSDDENEAMMIVVSVTPEKADGGRKDRIPGPVTQKLNQISHGVCVSARA